MTATPTQTLTPTPEPETPTPVAELQGPNIPVIGDTLPRVRDALESVLTTPRQRNTLIIILVIVAGIVIPVYIYLIRRRR